MENSTIFVNESLADFNSSDFNSTTIVETFGHSIDTIKLQFTDTGLLILNLGAIICFLLDKLFAQNGLWRVRNLNLLLCCLNAPLSVLPSMFLFRHKIRHPHFYCFVIVGFVLMFRYEFIYETRFFSWKTLGYFNFAFIVFSLVYHF